MMAVPLFRDLGLKVLAIALAVLLWLRVAGDPIAERSLLVPLEFQNLPDSVEILGGGAGDGGGADTRLVGGATAPRVG